MAAPATTSNPARVPSAQPVHRETYDLFVMAFSHRERLLAASALLVIRIGLAPLEQQGIRIREQDRAVLGGALQDRIHDRRPGPRRNVAAVESSLIEPEN